MNYIVYKTTNLINGKIYVGVHRTNPDIFDGYIGCGVTYKDKKRSIKKGFPAAVRKYGYKNFKRETLFIYPDTEEGREAAFKKEGEIVDETFVNRNDTYNLTIGGLFSLAGTNKTKIVQYTIDGKFIKIWPSIIEAQEILGLNAIDDNLIGISKYCGEYQWKYFTGSIDNIDPVETKEKKVYQFDLQGNLLKTYRSVTEAASQFNNPKSAKSSISQTCLGIHGQAYGYYWSYKDKFEPKKNNHLAPVAKYNDNGEFIESYSSIKEAADANNIKTPTNIIAAIKGSQKRCGGFRWRYFYGNTQNIKPL